MLIGIDGNEANIEKRVGVGRYAYELLKQFYELRLPAGKAGITNYEFILRINHYLICRSRLLGGDIAWWDQGGFGRNLVCR